MKKLFKKAGKKASFITDHPFAREMMNHLNIWTTSVTYAYYVNENIFSFLK